MFWTFLTEVGVELILPLLSGSWTDYLHDFGGTSEHTGGLTLCAEKKARLEVKAQRDKGVSGSTGWTEISSI